VYQGKETSDHLLARLQAFKQGSTKEQQVYACMVHNLFDEYRFFPKYPEKERHITALLLGGLVRIISFSYPAYCSQVLFSFFQ
jgi:CCR4-NOT transcription complex subunit 1